MKKILVVMCLIELLIGGCVSTQKVMDSYLGHHKREVYQKWGPPQRVSTDGDDGVILIYSTKLYTYSQNTQMTGMDQFAGSTWYEYRMFYCNANGNIYSWRTFNDLVPPQYLNVTLYIR